MDFLKIKNKVIDFSKKTKEKTIDFSKNTIDKTAKKIGESSIVLKNNSDLEDFIEKSRNKVIEKKDGELKINIKRTYLIIGDSKKDFFKDMIIRLPIFLTKTFSQNILLKLCDINNSEIDFSKYDTSILPMLIVFENTKIEKIISGEETLVKIIKNPSLDINKFIEEL